MTVAQQKEKVKQALEEYKKLDYEDMVSRTCSNCIGPLWLTKTRALNRSAISLPDSSIRRPLRKTMV